MIKNPEKDNPLINPNWWEEVVDEAERNGVSRQLLEEMVNSTIEDITFQNPLSRQDILRIIQEDILFFMLQDFANPYTEKSLEELRKNGISI